MISLLEFSDVCSFFEDHNILISEDQFNKVFDTLMESENLNSVLKKVDNEYEVLLQHMIKYQTNPNHQSLSWLGTIRDRSKAIMDICSSKRNMNGLEERMTEEKMQYIYEKAKKNAEEENNDSSKFPDKIPEYLKIKNVVDKNKINKFVNTYAKEDIVKERLEKLNNNIFVSKEEFKKIMDDNKKGRKK